MQGDKGKQYHSTTQPYNYRVHNTTSLFIATFGRRRELEKLRDFLYWPLAFIKTIPKTETNFVDTPAPPFLSCLLTFVTRSLFLKL